MKQNTTKKNRGTDSLVFRHQLTREMSRRRLSIRNIASLAEVSPSVVQGWLSGSNPHDLLAVNRLAKKFETNLETLLFGETESTVQIPTNDLNRCDEVEIVNGIFRISIKKIVENKCS